MSVFSASLATMLAISVMHVSQWMRAHLRINACHVPMATVFPEDVYRACTFRSFCASKNCGAGTLKHGAFKFERGRPKREGGRSATVCRFGENPALSLFIYVYLCLYLYLAHPHTHSHTLTLTRFSLLLFLSVDVML